MRKMNNGIGRAAVFVDLDGTLCEIFLWQALFSHHRTNRFKLGSLYLFIAFHMPIWIVHKAKLVSKETFYTLHATNLAWLLKDVPLARAEAIWDWVVDHEILPRVRPEMAHELETHKAVEKKIYLMSGSFSPLMDKLVSTMKLTGAIATPLEERNGRYTGRIIPPLGIGHGKAERLRRFLDELDEPIDLSNSNFYTDSYLDMPVMELFGNPIAVYPDKLLAAEAEERGWTTIGTSVSR